MTITLFIVTHPEMHLLHLWHSIPLSKFRLSLSILLKKFPTFCPLCQLFTHFIFQMDILLTPKAILILYRSCLHLMAFPLHHMYYLSTFSLILFIFFPRTAPCTFVHMYTMPRINIQFGSSFRLKSHPSVALKL